MDSAGQTENPTTKTTCIAAFLKAFESKAAEEGKGDSAKSFAAHFQEKTAKISQMETDNQKSPDGLRLPGSGIGNDGPVENQNICSVKIIPEIMSRKQGTNAVSIDEKENPSAEPKASGNFLNNFISFKSQSLSNQDKNASMDDLSAPETNTTDDLNKNDNPIFYIFPDSKQDSATIEGKPFINSTVLSPEKTNNDGLSAINPTMDQAADNSTQDTSDTAANRGVNLFTYSSFDQPAEGIKKQLASFLDGGENQALTTKVKHEKTEKDSINLMTLLTDGTAIAASATAEPLSAGDNRQTQSGEDDIEQLKEILAGILYGIQDEARAAGEQTVSTGLSKMFDQGKIAASPAITTQTSTGINDQIQSADNTLKQLKEILAAFFNDIERGEASINLNADYTEKKSDHDQPMSVTEMITASKTIIDTIPTTGDKEVIPANDKFDQSKNVLAALLQEIKPETSTVNQKSENSTVTDGIENVNASITEGNEPNARSNYEKHNNIETRKEAFLSHLSAFLKNRGIEDSPITNMITRIQNLSSTVQRKTATDSKVKETVASAAEQVRQEASVAGSKMEAVQSVIIDNSIKQTIGKSSTTQIGSNQEGMIVNNAWQAAEKPVQTISKTKNHDKLAITAEGESAVVPSVFSEIITNEVKTNRGVKIQSVIDQIAEARQQMERDFGRVKITLNPPNLGTVDLEVIVRQNKIEVTLIADNASVQQLLQSHSEEVKSALQRQDMKIDVFQVFVQNNNNGHQQQSNQWAFMQGNNQQAYTYGTDTEETTDQMSTDEEKLVSSARGSVSIFI